MSDTVCEAFVAVCDLGMALGIKPLNQHACCWEHQIDERWWIAVNGNSEAKPADSPQHKGFPIMVEPFHCYVEYNGWPAGIFTPRGGTIAAGECANEDEFIAAIRAAIAKPPGPQAAEPGAQTKG